MTARFVIIGAVLLVNTLFEIVAILAGGPAVDDGRVSLGVLVGLQIAVAVLALAIIAMAVTLTAGVECGQRWWRPRSWRGPHVLRLLRAPGKRAHGFAVGPVLVWWR